MENSFFLTLPSNSSSKFYPDNTSSNFTTQLAHGLQLDDSWQIGLTEIHLPTEYKTEIETDEHDIISHIEENTFFKLTKATFEDKSALCEHINEILELSASCNG